MKESALVAKIIKKVKERCPLAYCRKLSDRFTRGIPDILIVAPPKTWQGEWKAMRSCSMIRSFTLAIEAKNPSGRGKVSKIQELEGAEINRLPGAQWLVVTSVAEVLEVLEREGCC